MDSVFKSTSVYKETIKKKNSFTVARPTYSMYEGGKNKKLVAIDILKGFGDTILTLFSDCEDFLVRSLCTSGCCYKTNY